MDFAPSQTYRFGDVEIDLVRGTLVKNGEEIHLRQKTFQVLAYLIEHHGVDVPKDQIIKDVWRETAVVDDVLVQSVKDIRRALDDDPHKPRFIRTIPKVGYRFIGLVEQNGNGHKRSIETRFAASDESANRVGRPIFWTALILVIGLFVTGLALRSIWNEPKIDPTLTLSNPSGRPSLAVMFFENSSGDAELDWLREGIADMLVAGLSKNDALAVLSRGQLSVIIDRNGIDRRATFGLEKAVEIARQGKTLNVVTGSFARIGEKIRIDVQLYDTATGKLSGIESLTLDRAEDILDKIGLLSVKIASRIDGSGAEQGQSMTLARSMTSNLEAYRYYSLGLEKTQSLLNTEAVDLFEKAIELDAEFAMAHARIGYAYAVAWTQLDKGKPYLEKAFALSERLSEQDRMNIVAWYAIANSDYQTATDEFRKIVAKYPLETEGYVRLARLLQGEGHTDEAIQVLRSGLIVDPNSKQLTNHLGGQLSSLSRHNEAIAEHRRFTEMAPNDANAFDSLGLTYQWAGNYDAAVESYERALSLKPDFEVAVIHLANTRAQMGQYGRAVALFERYIAKAASDEERARGYVSLSVIALKQRDLESADRFNNLTKKLKPGWVWQSAMIGVERGDKRSLANVDEFFATFPTAGRGSRIGRRFEFYLRGYFALKQGRSEEAITHFRDALRSPPQTWDIDAYEDCLANAFFEVGRFDEAATEYERILAANPNYPLAAFNLARALEKKGDRAKASEFYRRFLESWKHADNDLAEIIAARRLLSAS